MPIKISTIKIFFFADELGPNDDDVHFMSHARGTDTQWLKKMQKSGCETLSKSFWPIILLLLTVFKF